MKTTYIIYRESENGVATDREYFVNVAGDFQNTRTVFSKNLSDAFGYTKIADAERMINMQRLHECRILALQTAIN